MSMPSLPEVLGKALARDLILSVGTHKGERPLAPGQVALALEQAVLAGFSKKQIADFLQLRDTSMVSRFLGILKLPDELAVLVGWGAQASLSLSSAHELVRLSDSSVRAELAKGVVENSLTKSEVVEAVQMLLRSSRSAKEVLDLIVNKRPTIERRFIFVGLFSDPQLTEALRQVEPLVQQDLLERAVRVLCNEGQLVHVRCMPPKFVVVCSKELHDGILSLSDGPEVEITRAIFQLLKDN